MTQMTIAQIRSQYPQYQDLNDQQLADAIYTSHYSDMDRRDFDNRIGLTQYWENQFEQATGATAGAEPDRRSDQQRAESFVQARRDQSGVNAPAGFMATGMAEAFNFSDEQAALGARVSNFYDRVSGRDRVPLDPSAVAEAERNRLEQARQEGGLGQTVREAAASAPTMFVGGTGLGGAVRTGAAFGGLAGVGAGETPEDRLASGALGAGVGALIGGAVQAGGDAVARGLSPLARSVQRRLSGDGRNMTRAQRRAFAELRQAFREEGMSGREAMDALRRYQDAGFDDASLLDLGSPGGPVQRLVRATGTRGGQSGRELEGLLQDRLDSQADRVGQRLSRYLSNVDDFSSEAAELVRARSERAAPLYRQAFYRDGAQVPAVGADEMAQLSRDADLAAPSVDEALAAARQLRAGKPQQGETLTRFVRRLGGVSDDRGDIAAAAGSQQRASSIVRSSGRQIDDLAQAAAESGYFVGGRPTRREFLDALSRDLSGDPVLAVDDASSLDRVELDRVREWFERNGVDWSETNDQALREQIGRAFAPQGGATASGGDLAREVREQAMSGALESAELVTMPREQVERVLVRIPRRARAVAERLARAEGRGLGSLDGQAIAVRDLHFIKMGLDDIISGSRRGQNSIANTERRALMQVRDDLRQAMPEAYRKATQEFAGDSALIDALEAGRRALRGDTEAVERLASDMTDSERQMFRAGLVRAAREQVERTQDGGDVVRRVIGNEDRRRRLAAAFDTPEDFERFVGALRAEQSRVQNARFVAPGTGSQTQMRGADLEREASGTLGDLIRGDFLGAISRVGYVGRDAARQAQRRATDQEITRIATAIQRQAAPEAQQVLLEQVAQEYGQETAQRVGALLGRTSTPAAITAVNAVNP